MVFAYAPRVGEFYGNRVKRWARCWRLTRRDGQIKRFTNHSNALQVVTDFSPFTTETFSPTNFGTNRESERRELAGAGGTDSITGFISASGWTPEDLRVGLYDSATVRVYDVDWRYPFAGWIYRNVFTMLDAAWNGEELTFRLATLAQKMNVQVGRVYTARCDATLGDARCSKDITGMNSGTRTVTAVVVADGSPRLRFESNNTAQADGFWTDGMLTWISGNNAITGVNKQQVKRSIQTDGVMELWTPTPYDIEVGDTFSVTPGCNKLAQQHCRQKFSNLVNHRGFPHMSGFDKVITGPDSSI